MPSRQHPSQNRCWTIKEAKSLTQLRSASLCRQPSQCWLQEQISEVIIVPDSKAMYGPTCMGFYLPMLIELLYKLSVKNIKSASSRVEHCVPDMGQVGVSVSHIGSFPPWLFSLTGIATYTENYFIFLVLMGSVERSHSINLEFRHLKLLIKLRDINWYWNQDSLRSCVKTDFCVSKQSPFSVS